MGTPKLLKLVGGLDARIEITWPCGLDKNYYGAHINDAEIKVKGGFLTETTGFGLTPDLALEALWQRIRGETLVFSAHGRKRREVFVADSRD